MLLLIANAMSWPSFPPTQLPNGPAANCLVAHEASYARTKRMPHASRGSLASPSNASSRPAVNRKQATFEAEAQDAQLRNHISGIQLVTLRTETKNPLKRPSLPSIPASSALGVMDFHDYKFLSCFEGKEYLVSFFTDDTALRLTLRSVCLF